MGKLPATVRAELRWLPKALEASLQRLLEEPLTPGLLKEVSAELTTAAAQLAARLHEAAPSFFEEASSPLVEAAIRSAKEELGALPLRARGGAYRAFVTVLAVGHMGLQLLARGGLDVQQALVEAEAVLAAEERHPGQDLLDAQAAVTGMRFAIRKLGPAHPRTVALAKCADEAAFSFAKREAAAGPHARLPWYFETECVPPGVARIALWTEEGRVRNEKALELLGRWKREDDRAEGAAEWERVKRELDAERGKDARLFS